MPRNNAIPVPFMLHWADETLDTAEDMIGKCDVELAGYSVEMANGVYLCLQNWVAAGGRISNGEEEVLDKLEKRYDLIRERVNEMEDNMAKEAAKE